MAPRILLPGITLEAELGQGAHSIVYRGSLGGRACAVKLPRRRAQWSRWVYREAVALARVRHPALPEVLEVGEVDGFPYLAMELVAGETLASRLRRGSLPEREIVALGLTLTSALGAVHDARLVHRDVKPANILVEPSGGIRLVDFGFATPLERAGGAEEAGTRRYAAPEQLRAPSHVDGRADLFALGRVLYECAGGNVASEDGIPLHSLERRSLSDGLAKILLGLSAHEPDRRYPHAQSAHDDLSRLASGQTVRGAHRSRRTAPLPPLVGRDDHLRRVARAVADGKAKRGSVTFVHGARGSGKSLLLATAAERARETGVVVLTTTCRPEDAPLACLRRLFEGFEQQTLDLGPTEREASLDALRMAAGDDLASFLLLIAPSLGGVVQAPATAPTTATGTFGEGVAELFVRLSRRVGRILLAIDDLWAMDPASREVLICLAYRCGEAPVALLFTDREETVTPGTDTRLGELDPARTHRLDLGGLTPQQQRDLLTTYLAGPSLDEGLLQRVISLTDETPLALLEVVGAFLDNGAIRLEASSWRLDRERAAGVVLPDGTRALLGHRLADLPPATRSLLEWAAVAGPTFEPTFVARAMGLSARDVGFGIAEAQRAGIVEAESGGRHRFVHDSLRETVLRGLAPERLGVLSLAAADTLEESGPLGPDQLAEVALYHLRGGLHHAPARAARAARAAADVAFERFDHETARRFYQIAEQAQALAGGAFEGEFYRRFGEVQLQAGALDAAMSAFRQALATAEDRRGRAALLGRIAWAHHMKAEPDLAWSVLSAAFGALGLHMPTESPLSLGASAARLGARGLGWRRNAEDRATLELLCDLHYQNARLGLEYGKPARLVQSILAAREASQILGTSRSTSRARAMSGFLLAAARRPESAARELALAKAEAQKLDDPVTAAFCVQLISVGALWTGEFERGLALVRELVEVRGPWLEVAELALACANAEVVYALRGRPAEAWIWVERGLDRYRRSPKGVTEPQPHYLQRVLAVRAAMGRADQDDPRLTHQLGSAADAPPPGDLFQRTLWWGPRVRVYLERDDLGLAFEDLLRAFERDGHRPRTAHPTLQDYYVAVGHARAHQCLQATGHSRTLRLPALARAVDDLKLAARWDLIRAHALLLEGTHALLVGRHDEGNALLVRAEHLAHQESAPGVLYGIARIRAHVFRDLGKVDAALDQARLALTLATTHGAEVRARWIRDEFELQDSASRSSTSSLPPGPPSLRRVRHQLAALVQIVRSPSAAREPNEHATAILDDLLRDIDAERGTLWFEPDADGRAQPFFGRQRRGDAWTEGEGFRTRLLRAVRQRGEPWPPETGEEPPLLLHAMPDPQRVLAVPLFLYDRAVGAVCLERDPQAPPFSEDDRELLLVLAHQVPIALEIARLLAQREQLQTSLQHAQKMEAVGQLAGGIAHDFNNMLMVIQTSLDTLRERPGADGEVLGEVDLIAKVATRAGELTKQLLGFSRHRPLPLAPHDATTLLGGLAPMLQRVLGQRKLELVLAAELPAINTDRASFEQAIVNLAVNARDAMPSGGTLTIRSDRVRADDPAIRRQASNVSEHIVVSVSDTGQGMSPELRERVFEPFFTTKPLGGGTGLGLTTVYTFMKSCGGFVDVTSELGEGTTFRLYFPSSPIEETRPSSIPPPASARAPGIETVLVVDDDPLVARSIQKVLARNGYNVLIAHGAEDALEVIRQTTVHIAMAVIDVLMPGMSGPELGRRLLETTPSLRLLYVSGFAPQDVGDFQPQQLLQKPFSAVDLLSRVRVVLDTGHVAPT